MVKKNKNLKTTPTRKELINIKDFRKKSIQNIPLREFLQSQPNKKVNKAIKEARKHNREGHMHIITIVYMYTLSIVYFIMFLVWIWNLITPANWNFLNQERTNDLSVFFAGSTIGSVIINKVITFFEKFE